MPHSSLLSDSSRYSNQRENSFRNGESTDICLSDLGTGSIFNFLPVQQTKLGYTPKWKTYYEECKAGKKEISKTVQKEAVDQIKSAEKEDEAKRTNKSTNEEDQGDSRHIEHVRQELNTAVMNVSTVDKKLSKFIVLPTDFSQKFGQKLEATRTVTPPANAATIVNICMSSEQMNGTFSTVTTSADYFQSVFINTSSFANVFKFEDSEFWFPKIKVRDKLSRFSGIRTFRCHSGHTSIATTAQYSRKTENRFLPTEKFSKSSTFRRPR